MIGSPTAGVWFTSLISISTVVLSPSVSQAADYWGRKWLLVILTFCGTIGAIVVSRADTIGMAIAGFAITGLSYGAQPLLHAVVSEVLPRKYRPYAQGSVNVSASLGAVFALLVGGALTRNQNATGFRVYWYITAGIYAGSAIACAVLYNPPLRELQVSLTMRQKLGRLDWIGFGLLTSGLILFCMGLSWSQNPYHFTNPHVLAPFLVGVALIAGLIVYEVFVKKDGMFHHALFRHRNFPLALTCVFVEGLIFFTANNYFAFQVSVVYTADPLRVGLHYCIAFFMFATSSIITGIYSSKAKAIRIPCLIAFASFLLFNILMATVRPSTPIAAIWIYPIFLGIGLGVCLTVLVTAAQFATPPALIAITSGLMISVRSLGGSIGLAIYSAIFNGTLANELGAKIAAAVLPLGLSPNSLGAFIGALSANDAKALMNIPGVTPQMIGAGVVALKEAFSVAFRWVWVAAGCFSVLAVVRE